MRRAFHSFPADFIDDDATLEMELTPAQREMLARAAEPEAPPPPAMRSIVEQAPPLIPVRSPVARRNEPPAPKQAVTRPNTTPAPIPAAARPNEASAPICPGEAPALGSGGPRSRSGETSAPAGPRAHEAPAHLRAAGRRWIFRLAIGLGIVAICAFSASVAYLTRPTPTTTSPPPAEVVAPEPASPAEPAPPPDMGHPAIIPVRFANPFDATEVFEFPPGTSETEARDAVADLLLKRARERLNLSSDTSDPPKPSGDPAAGAPRSRLARRG